MSSCSSLEDFKKYLNNEIEDLSFLSKSFFAIRDFDKQLLTGVEAFTKHYTKLKSRGIIDISFQKEDSHYLMFYSVSDVKYMAKIKLDSDEKVWGIVEEIFDINKKNVVIVVEYDGTNYYGMQRLHEKSSIQKAIDKSLSIMLKKDVQCFIASRTDKGVHAKGQVVHFDANGIAPIRYKNALNRLLPKDIRVVEAYERSQLFHARFDVVKKEYQYVIDTGEYSVFEKNYVWYQKINDLERIKKDLKNIEGTHDFISFCKGEKEDTIRTIYEVSVKEEREKIIFKFVGSGFLHNMIRLIMGSLIEIDKTGQGSIKELLEKKDKNLTSKIAPSTGLYLIKIEY